MKEKIKRVRIYRGKKYLKSIMRKAIIQGCKCGKHTHHRFCKYKNKKYEIKNGMIKV